MGHHASSDSPNNSSKSALRKEARAGRAQLPSAYRAKADAAVARLVAGHPLFADAPLILAYCSVEDEVDTRVLIEKALRQGKPVALPRCRPATRTMDWHRIDSLAALVPGYGNIPEPPDNPATLVDPAAAGPHALALVPALVIDDAGFRLGYGGGYYDRFLATFSGVSLGLIRRRQRIPSLQECGAAGPFDLPVNAVADEDGVQLVVQPTKS